MLLQHFQDMGKTWSKHGHVLGMSYVGQLPFGGHGLPMIWSWLFGQNVALTTIMLPPGMGKILALSWPGVGLLYISL